jgi:hypothetical protein
MIAESDYVSNAVSLFLAQPPLEFGVKCIPAFGPPYVPLTPTALSSPWTGPTAADVTEATAMVQYSIVTSCCCFSMIILVHTVTAGTRGSVSILYYAWHEQYCDGYMDDGASSLQTVPCDLRWRCTRAGMLYWFVRRVR